MKVIASIDKFLRGESFVISDGSATRQEDAIEEECMVKIDVNMSNQESMCRPRSLKKHSEIVFNDLLDGGAS